MHLEQSQQSSSFSTQKTCSSHKKSIFEWLFPSNSLPGLCLPLWLPFFATSKETKPINEKVHKFSRFADDLNFVSTPTYRKAVEENNKRLKNEESLKKFYELKQQQRLSGSRKAKRQTKLRNLFKWKNDIISPFSPCTSVCDSLFNKNIHAIAFKSL